MISTVSVESYIKLVEEDLLEVEVALKPVSKAKVQSLDVLRRIEEQHTKVVITKNGAPKAVLLPYKDFEGLGETINILANPATVKGLRKGLDDISAGRVVSLEEAFVD